MGHTIKIVYYISVNRHMGFMGMIVTHYSHFAQATTQLVAKFVFLNPISRTYKVLSLGLV